MRNTWIAMMIVLFAGCHNARKTAPPETLQPNIDVLRFVEGKPFEFVLKDIDGRIIRSSDLKGKVVLVDVWATWCAPCRASTPAMKKLYAELDGKLEIVGLSVDKRASASRSYAEKHGVTWPQVWAGSLLRHIETKGIPFYLVIDKKGILHGTKLGGSPPETMIRVLADE